MVPYEHQFVCASNVDDGNRAKNNEILCFKPDSSLDVLIVAPIMSFLNASGGGDKYSKYPKAVLDRSGEYILWSSNMRSNRMDIFVARVPYHLLVAEEDYNPSSTPQSATSPSSAPQSMTTPSSSPQGSNGPASTPLRSTSGAKSQTLFTAVQYLVVICALLSI